MRVPRPTFLVHTQPSRTHQALTTRTVRTCKKYCKTLKIKQQEPNLQRTFRVDTAILLCMFPVVWLSRVAGKLKADTCCMLMSMVSMVSIMYRCALELRETFACQALSWQPPATHAPDLVAVGMQWLTCFSVKEGDRVS